ncbi:MAG: hypothetical protein ABIN67_15975 [Ferruginibacter sp.]
MAKLNNLQIIIPYPIIRNNSRGQGRRMVVTVATNEGAVSPTKVYTFLKGVNFTQITIFCWLRNTISCKQLYKFR